VIERPLDFASYYPLRTTCGGCGRWVEGRLRWKARCRQCFEAHDREVGIPECALRGLTVDDRRSLPFRWQYVGLARYKRYKLSDVAYLWLRKLSSQRWMWL